MKILYKVRKGISGLGLFAAAEIKKDQNIVQYTGEYISDDEAMKRRGRYLMEIDKNVNLDGSSRSNTARYANHSCKPNAKAESVGKSVYIVAKRKIKEGEEITYNYGKAYFDEFIKPHGCNCGADKHLW